MTENRKRVFFVAMFALVFYLVGASFVESFVSYPTWKTVGTNDFRTYYAELSSRIVGVMVLPGILEMLLTIPLLWWRPQPVPRWPIVLALILNVARFVSTAVIQLQVREQLSIDGSLSLNMINTVIWSDYFTQAASLARAFLYLWMMFLVVDLKSQVHARN